MFLVSVVFIINITFNFCFITFVTNALFCRIYLKFELSGSNWG